MEDPRQEMVSLLPQLRGFARSLCSGDWQLADDLVQDTVMLALRAWDSFEPGTSLKSWLLKILHNRFHSLKRRKYHTSEIARDDLDMLSSVPPTQHSRLEVSAFKQAFARLKPEHRSVLVLSAVHGQPYDAIADICGCEVGTVKSRISRARAQLKAMLLSDAGEAPEPEATPAARRAGAPRRRQPAGMRAAPPAAAPIAVVESAPPVIVLVPRRAQPPKRSMLDETEIEIVRAELRLTRCRRVAAHLARTGVDVVATETLAKGVGVHLAALHARRDRLLRDGDGNGRARAA